MKDVLKEVFAWTGVGCFLIFAAILLFRKWIRIPQHTIIFDFVYLTVAVIWAITGISFLIWAFLLTRK